MTRNIAHPAISTIHDPARQSCRAVIILALAAAAFMALPVAATADVSTEEKARIAPITAPFDMPQLQRPVFPDRSFNLTNYGAVGNGTTKNTEAFRRAITACNAAGGGRGRMTSR